MISAQLSLKPDHCGLCHTPREEVNDGIFYQLELISNKDGFSFSLVRTLATSAACKKCWNKVFKEMFYETARGDTKFFTELNKTEARLVEHLNDYEFISSQDLALCIYEAITPSTTMMVRRDVMRARKKGIAIVTQKGGGYKLEKGVY